MIDLFQFAPQDKALEYLAKIFGYMNGIIPVTGISSTLSVVGGQVTTTNAGTASGAAGTSITLLGTMFKTFNSVVLAVAVLVVVYTTVVGVLMTAQEGEFMGKKWHSFWTPLRTVMGIAFLVPTASGYCILQLMMMWVIVQGVGAADTLWNTVLAYVDVMGSPYAQATMLPSVGYQSTFNTFFRGVVCDSTAKMNFALFDSDDGGGYYCASSHKHDSFCKKSTPMSFTTTTSRSFGPGGACGTLTWCDQSTTGDGACSSKKGGSSGLACKACQQEISALQTVYPVLSTVAVLFVMADMNYRSYISQVYATQDKVIENDDGTTTTEKGHGTPPAVPGWVQAYCTANNISPCTRDVNTGDGLPDPGITSASPSSTTVNQLYWKYYLKPMLGPQYANANFTGTALTEFTKTLNDLFDAYNKEMEARIADPTQLTNSDLSQAAEYGWIMAGSYYYTIAKMNNNNLKDAMPTLDYSFPDTDSRPPISPSNTMYDYRNNYSGAGYLVTASSSTSDASSGSSNLPSDIDELSSVTQDVTASIQETTEGSLSGDANPLVQAQQAGYAILMIAQIGFFIFLGLSFMLALAGNISVYVLGTGVTNPVGPALQLMYMLLIPAVVGLFGIMVTLGATLSVYLPLVPFVIFTFGAIGWLTSTIETMVAGPLVALGVIAPGGHHEVFGKAEPALMLLFNVFLRPSLMIFGMVAAMLLASVVVGMINGAFWRVMTSISAGSSSSSTAGEAANVMSPLTLILFLCAYVMMVISALNKCFAAIHIIPERVMRWIGGQGEQYGEGESLSDVKGGVASGAKGAGSAAGTASKAPKAYGEASGKQLGAQREEEKAKQAATIAAASQDTDKGKTPPGEG